MPAFGILLQDEVNQQGRLCRHPQKDIIKLFVAGNEMVGRQDQGLRKHLFSHIVGRMQDIYTVKLLHVNIWSHGSTKVCGSGGGGQRDALGLLTLEFLKLPELAQGSLYLVQAAVRTMVHMEN